MPSLALAIDPSCKVRPKQKAQAGTEPLTLTSIALCDMVPDPSTVWLSQVAVPASIAPPARNRA
jgi:hypothetical protein